MKLGGISHQASELVHGADELTKYLNPGTNIRNVLII